MESNPIPPPPQNPGYYRPPTNSPLDPYRPPGIYFDSISTAITLLQRDLAIWVGATFFYIVASVPLTIVAMLVQGHGQFLYSGPFDWNTWMQGEAISIFNSFVTTSLFGGMVHMGMKAANGEPLESKDLFKAFPQIWSVGLMVIVLTIVLLCGYVLLLVPGIFLTGVFALALPIIVEQKVGVVEGLKRSFEALKPFAWAMFGLIFVAGLVSGLGYLACGIGILFSFPIFPIVLGIHYNYFFPKSQLPQATAYQFLEPPR